MVYELPTKSFLKNIAYIRKSLNEKFPKEFNGQYTIVDDYNKEIALAGNSIIKIQEVFNKYLDILNDKVQVTVEPKEVKEETTKKKKSRKKKGEKVNENTTRTDN